MVEQAGPASGNVGSTELRLELAAVDGRGQSSESRPELAPELRLDLVLDS